LVIKDGRVVESGRHEELLARGEERAKRGEGKGVYFEMWDKQSSEEEKQRKALLLTGSLNESEENHFSEIKSNGIDSSSSSSSSLNNNNQTSTTTITTTNNGKTVEMDSTNYDHSAGRKKVNKKRK